MAIPENVFIKRAKLLVDYRIRFEFTDGRSTEIDFHPILTQPGQNPMATQYLDITRFKNFKIDGRADIVWGDWEMCFPFAALYAGDLAVDSLGNKKKVSRKPLRGILGKSKLEKLDGVRNVPVSSGAGSRSRSAVKKRTPGPVQA